ENGAELSRSWRLAGRLRGEELTDRGRWPRGGWLEGRRGKPRRAPLVRIDLIAEGDSPAGAAPSGLRGEASRHEEHATRAANRVQSLLGAGGVLPAVPRGGRSPRERIRYVAWGDDQVAERAPAAPWPGQLPTPLPTTVFPEPIRVELLAEGTPVRMAARGGLSRGPEELNYDRGLYPVDSWAGTWT